MIAWTVLVRGSDAGCGHNHRTESAAESCRLRLLRVGRDESGYPAMWHNAYVSRIDTRTGNAADWREERELRYS